MALKHPSKNRHIRNLAILVPALFGALILSGGLIWHHFGRNPGRAPGSIPEKDASVDSTPDIDSMLPPKGKFPLPGGNSKSGATKARPAGPPPVPQDHFVGGTLQDFIHNSQIPWQVDYADAKQRWPRALRQGSYLIQGDNDEDRAQDLLMTYSEKTFGVPYTRLRHSSTHEGDQTYITYEQTENELPILGARIVMVFENRSLVRVMNDLVPRERSARSAGRILLSDAAQIAINAAESFRMDDSRLAISANPRLVYLPSATGNLQLVYQTGVAVEGSRPRQLQVLIDAQSGDVVRVRDTLKH